MLVVKTFQNVPIISNCYLVHPNGGGNAIIVDPGSEDSSGIIDYLNDFKLQVDFIILTHEHFDHIWGVEKIRRIFNCKLIASDICSEAITDPKKNLSLFYDQKGFSIQGADIVINEEDKYISWSGYQLHIIRTPGHTRGSISFFIEGYLFTGDTLLKNGKAVTRLPGGSKKDLIKSLSRIQNMANEIILVLPGHGETFTVNDMKERNSL